MDTLRYPIGQFPAVQGPTGEDRKLKLYCPVTHVFTREIDNILKSWG